MTNSTISGNMAAADGGGIYTDVGGSLTLTNVTIVGNTTESFDSGDGLFVSGSPADIKNTIIAANVDASGVAPDCAGPVNSLGHNLIEDTTGCTISGDTTSNIIGQSPNIGPLADNGGPTQTHALLPGSPALDAGDNVGCPATDQRGAARPQDADGDLSAVCDIGAYEAGTGEPTPTATATATATTTATATATARSRPPEAVTTTPTATSAPTQAVTATPTPTDTPTQVATATPTATGAPTQAATATPTATSAPTQVATPTPAPTRTPAVLPIALPATGSGGLDGAGLRFWWAMVAAAAALLSGAMLAGWRRRG